MDYELQIGQRIKTFRMKLGKTIKELAEQAQITSSMLSQIERGQANPSLNTIRLLSQALNVPMFRLFMDDIGVESEVVRKNKRRHIMENGLDYELLSPDTNGNLEMLQFSLKPGKDSCTTPMGHTGEEIAIVLEGSTELTLGEEQCVLNEGDSVRIRSGVLHSWRNIGEEDLVLIFAVSPPTF